jgi:quinol monooxygenase YgiN
MVILHVTVQVKPEHVPEYLEAVRHDAEHSERDEPGCLRFDVIQDRDDANRFYYRQSPHFKLYVEKTSAWLAAAPERRFGKNLIPADSQWR